MICPHCGTRNKDENVFCTECGWKLIRPEEPRGESFETPFEAPREEPRAPHYDEFFPGPGEGDRGMEEPVRKIGFKEAVVSFFKNYVNFKDRATRSEYWYYVLFAVLVGIVLSIISGGILVWVWTLGTVVPSLALSWRRLHDIGKSGLFCLLALIPFVGGIILVVMFCKDSDGDNQYGPRKTERNRYNPTF